MLQLIHKYRRSLIGVTFLLLMALSLSGLGLNFFRSSSGPKNYAIKVNDTEISLTDFAKFTRGSQQNPQRVADQLISASLIEQQAQRLNFRSGEDSVRAELGDMFQGSFDPEQYKQFLETSGLSAQQFEGRLRDDALQNQVVQLLSDVSFASNREAEMRLVIERTKYNVQYLELDPQSFVDKTPLPSDGAVEEYYNDHSADFELPAGVSYDYVLFTPEQYARSVEVAPEDVELYYADHESDYNEPESVKARYIRLSYGKDSTPQQMTDLKEKANQILARAKAGESFDSLALEFSDDLDTKPNGGDLGWIARGKMPKDFDTAAFKLKGAGIADLVQTELGFEIIKVEDYKAARTKPLTEVRDQIISELQKRDAPLYAANRAQELYDQWTKSNSALTDFAKEHGLTVASTKDVSTKDIDPEDNAKGLTAQVLQQSGDQKQLADIGDKSALVQVRQFREADVAPLKAVKEKIIAALRVGESKELARKEAARLVEEIGKNAKGSLAEVADAGKLKLQSANDLLRNKEQTGIFSDSAISRAVFSTFTAGQKPSQAFEHDGKFYILQVAAINKPSAEDTAKSLQTFKHVQSSRIAATFVDSIVNQLKKDADIEISPQVLAEEG